ncbi:nucleotidyl transferase AbiEii/AbiGii toxin family protein [Nocardioides sp. NPDC059952]|uniref:nucleotidyl transferase AbiEii/AbiGii toxin family protein n=1 Tax=Nocardioides sp. NPDC059952 TaxID=3347014 RepID=UPI003646880E
MSRATRETAAGRAYLDLQNRARRERRRTQDLLTMYVVERWLARMSTSPYAGDFVLKGGMLLASFGSRRPTTDADALARNMPADESAVAARVVEIAGLADPDDGVIYLTETVKAAMIRDDALYSGVRVTMDAELGTARLKLKLDINFGDPVTPEPSVVELPALRPGTAPVRILGYPIATVLAEKISTAIDLGPASTRVRDWADIYTLVTTHDLGCAEVRTAVAATMAFRGVEVRPLSDAIGDLVRVRASAYVAYRRGLGADGEHLPATFEDVVAMAVRFADPVLSADAIGTAQWRAEARGWS